MKSHYDGFTGGAPLLDLGFLIARLVIGLLVAAHGAQKLFGWFGGHGLQATGEFFGKLGFQPGRLFATSAAVGEFVSGLLIALGFLGPVGPAILLAVMIVAAISVHWQNGLFAMTNGIELPLLYGTAAVRFALAGPGRYSLDEIFGIRFAWTPAAIWSALAIGLVGGIANLALRRQPTAPAV
ncbi:MAG TPA: DoxX family protein [Thermoanaerobaculia bacterium]|nr:DoxX family protein [Thermoanaerobaculia bacterium]